MTNKSKTLKHYLFVGALSGSAFALLGTASAFAFTGQQYESHANVKMSQAEATVAKTIPGGKITDRELEKEKGGSGLRYSFDVKSHGKTLEVGVDAMTGKVLEDSLEGPNAD